MLQEGNGLNEWQERMLVLTFAFSSDVATPQTWLHVFFYGCISVMK